MTTMPREEVEALLERERFQYQRIELPYGLHTRGQDRSDTARAILPDDMSGTSVLDIGCCYGFFLYEAQRRGATRLRGLEIDPKRLRQARLLADVKEGPIEFSDEDFFDVCAKERFDYILMLNLIHHLPDPIAGLRVAARSARKALIIEFPTPADPKFKRELPRGMAKRLKKLPVIAVSTLAEHDQTFLFSQPAIERIFTDHEDLAGRIDFLPSPHSKKERMIAIVHVKEAAGQ